MNAIGPGYFVTELTQVLLDRPDFNKMVTTRTPLGFWGIPEDLQGACIFLGAAKALSVGLADGTGWLLVLLVLL